MGNKGCTWLKSIKLLHLGWQDCCRVPAGIVVYALPIQPIRGRGPEFNINQRPTSTSDLSNTTANFGLFFLIALLAHTGRGMSPPLARYFQVVVGLPLFVFVIIPGVPLLLGHIFYTLPKSGFAIWRNRILFATSSLLVLRVISNISASRFTKAIYVQLFALMIPFFVVILSQIFLKEKPPKYTWTAIILSSIGAFLMLSSDIGTDGIAFGLSRLDKIGIGFAIAQAIIASGHFVMLRRAKQAGIANHEILTSQSVMVALVAMPISLATREDWSILFTMSSWQWAALVFFAFVPVLAANWFQITAIANIGANAFSSALPWRLLTVLIVGWFLLGERLESVWQVLGAIIVFLTITGYFYLRQRDEKLTRSG